MGKGDFAVNGEKNLHQNIALFDRQRAQLTGIEEVESFTETEIAALSVLGEITIWGEGLKIRHFSTESGEMEIDGSIESIAYGTRDTGVKKGFFQRLLH